MWWRCRPDLNAATNAGVEAFNPFGAGGYGGGCVFGFADVGVDNADACKRQCCNNGLLHKYSSVLAPSSPCLGTGRCKLVENLARCFLGEKQKTRANFSADTGYIKIWKLTSPL